MNSRLQVKIRTGDSNRRYSFDQPPSWKTFIDHLKSHLYPENTSATTAYNTSFRVEYKDEEEDLVTIDSEEEWQEMLKYKNTNLVTLFIKELPPNNNNTNHQIQNNNNNLLEAQKQDELKKQEERKQQERIREEEERRRKEEEDRISKEEEEERRRKEEDEKIELERRLKEEEEEKRRRDEEEKRKEELLFKDEEKRLKDLNKQQKEEEEEAKYLLCLEKLKLMEQEREEKTPSPHKKPTHTKPPASTSSSIPQTDKNHYIKLYAPKLHTLYEAGFQDIQRNLYLLITFNGNIETVIDKLLQSK